MDTIKMAGYNFLRNPLNMGIKLNGSTRRMIVTYAKKKM